MSESKPRRFRIPKLLWFVLAAVLMVGLWVFLAVWFPYQREQVAIREIKRLGGVILRTEKTLPERIGESFEWLQEMVDDGWLPWFESALSVGFSETANSDEGLEYLGDLTNLKYLVLNSTQVSDEGLKHLSGLTKLQSLDLINTQISDEGLKHLSGLNNLYLLDLRNTQVTEEGVKELQKALPDCEILY